MIPTLISAQIRKPNFDLLKQSAFVLFYLTPRINLRSHPKMAGRDSSVPNDPTSSSSGRTKTKEEATNEINAALAEYEDCNLVDRDLWEGFKENFC